MYIGDQLLPIHMQGINCGYYISTLSLSPSKTTQHFVCIVVD